MLRKGANFTRALSKNATKSYGLYSLFNKSGILFVRTRRENINITCFIWCERSWLLFFIIFGRVIDVRIFTSTWSIFFRVKSLTVTICFEAEFFGLGPSHRGKSKTLRFHNANIKGSMILQFHHIFYGSLRPKVS